MVNTALRIRDCSIVAPASELAHRGFFYVPGTHPFKPGEENLYLLESIRTSNIELVLTRHEQGAGFMAATYGRFTGKARVADHDHRSRAGPEGLSPLKNSHTKAWVQT